MIESVKIDGEKLHQVRTARWLDRAEVAQRSGVNRKTLEDIEGGRWPGGSKLSTVRKLAEALEVDPHELLENHD